MNEPSPGTRAGGRYRLEARLGSGPDGSVWRATDETLERQVSVRIFDAAQDPTELQESAGIAASLTHPRVVRIFDTGIDGGRFFTVSELLPGSLSWARMPLEPEDAARVGRDLAEALAYAHDRSVAHGAIHPGNVLLGEHGAKLADFALASGRQNGQASTDADLRQLGDLLYAALTGRRAGGPSDATGRLLPDHPPGLAAVVDKLRSGSYQDAHGALRDLRDVADQAAPSVGTRPRSRRLLPVAVALALLVLVAAAGVALLNGDAPPRESSTRRPAGPPHAVATVADYDPEGDGREQRQLVPLIADGDPATFWRTERYRTGPSFAGDKSGVGVILDLGREVPVSAARVVLPTEGCGLDVRYSPVRSAGLEGWRRVAGSDHAPTTIDLAFDGANSRWWLVWVTSLTANVPGAGGSYACGISEVLLFER